MLHVFFTCAHGHRHHGRPIEVDECVIYMSSGHRYMSSRRFLNDDDEFEMSEQLSTLLCSGKNLKSGDYRDLVIVLTCLIQLSRAYTFSDFDSVPLLMQRVRRHARVTVLDDLTHHEELVTTHEMDIKNMCEF